MRKNKLYNYIKEQDKEMLSLNYLLAEKYIVDWKGLDIKHGQSKVYSRRFSNCDYFTTIFSKHISRYLSDVHKAKVIKL